MTELLDYDEALELFDPVMALEVHVELQVELGQFKACRTVHACMGK